MTQNNFLSPLHFVFKLDRTPNIEYSVQRVDIPGMELSTVEQPTPFVRVPLPGQISYDDLRVTFKVGENLEGYLEVVDWMNALGHPDDFGQFQMIKSDCQVVILNSVKRPHLSVAFTDAYPVAIGPLVFDATAEDIRFITVDVTFRFLRYKFNTL